MLLPSLCDFDVCWQVEMMNEKLKTYSRDYRPFNMKVSPCRGETTLDKPQSPFKFQHINEIYAPAYIVITTLTAKRD